MALSTYNDPIYLNLHKNSSGKPVSLKIENERQKVYKNVVVLNELPDQYYKVNIYGMNEAKQIFNENNYIVDYTYGMIYLHPSIADGTEITITEYYGRGYALIPSSRIYTTMRADGTVEGMDEYLSSVKPFEYKGVYSTTQQYRKNNQVYYKGSTYICLEDCIGRTPTDTSFWRVFAASLNWMGAYDQNKLYHERDVVSHADSNVYICIKDCVSGVGIANAAYWDKLIDLSAYIRDLRSLLTQSETIANNLQGQIDDYQNNLKPQIDSSITSANAAANNANSAKNDVDNALQDYEDMLYNGIQILKEPVINFEDIATTYPSPQNGWTVKILNDGRTFRYNGKTNDWVWINTSSDDGHIHINKVTLDKLSENAGNLQYNGKNIVDHTHANKNVIDKFTDDNGVLKYNGTLIDGGVNELAQKVGDLTTLTTTAKNNIVSAINEVHIKPEVEELKNNIVNLTTRLGTTESSVASLDNTINPKLDTINTTTKDSQSKIGVSTDTSKPNATIFDKLIEISGTTASGTGKLDRLLALIGTPNDSITAQTVFGKLNAILAK